MNDVPQFQPAVFAEQFERFKRAVKDHPDSDGPFTTFGSGLADRWEFYKENVYREARRRPAEEGDSGNVRNGAAPGSRR